MEKALPCPFCGKDPIVLPEYPEKEGAGWGEVRCINGLCSAQPTVQDGEEIVDERGSDAYKEAAIKRWNIRF